METANLHIYTTRLPDGGTVQALMVLGIPIPVGYHHGSPVVLQHCFPRPDFRASICIKSRPWDGAEYIHWESEDPLSPDDMEQLKKTWETPDLGPAVLHMAAEIARLQGAMEHNHSSIGKWMKDLEQRMVERIDRQSSRCINDLGALSTTEGEHYGEHSISIGDLEEKVAELLKKVAELSKSAWKEVVPVESVPGKRRSGKRRRGSR